MYLPQEIIRNKREGRVLSEHEIYAFIQGVTDGSVSDAQISALAMATYFQGMDTSERINFTCAMRDSGHVLSWNTQELGGPVVDKHSTGGVGDMVSLMLGPMVAACGGFIPMISGRGLGHTGGTLDKLDAIPGYQTSISNDRLIDVVKLAGIAIVGQTGDLAPADKRIYAVRDTTATVESVGMITASILSKKLAEGLDALVMDVKVGNGAFMPTMEQSIELAQSIVDVANGAGVKTTALLTDMNQPLGSSAGNAVEIAEAVRFLTGEYRNWRLLEVTLAQGAALLVNAKLAHDEEDARSKLMNALDSGQAAEIFGKMVFELGGPVDFVERYDQFLPTAAIIKPVYLASSGVVASMDTREIGMAVVQLGGGRTLPTDTLDYSVGFERMVQIGDKVDHTAPVAMLHANSDEAWGMAAQRLIKAITLSDRVQRPNPLVYQQIS